MADETLTALIGESIDVTAGGTTLSIRPYTFGQLPRVMEHLGPAVHHLLATGEIDLAGLLRDETERVVALCMLATGQTRAWFDALPADEGVQIAAAVAEVNASFFVRRLQPAAAAAWARMKSRWSEMQTKANPAGIGPTSSPDS